MTVKNSMVGQHNSFLRSPQPSALSPARDSRFTAGFGGAQTRSSRSSSNGTLATATPLGTFPPGQTRVRDSVGRGNPLDFMRIDLTENSRMRLVLANRSQTQISATLLDATGAVANPRNGRQILAVAAQKQGQTVFSGVKPGTYYLRVKSAASGTNVYQANLFVNPTGGPSPLPCGCGV